MAAAVLLVLTQRDPDVKVNAVSDVLPTIVTPPRVGAHGELVSQVHDALEAIPPTTTTTTAPPAAPTPPTRQPTPPPAGACGGWESTIAAHFPADVIGTVCRIIGCETGYTYSPTIHNQSSSASGIAQFLDSTWVSTTGLSPPAAAHPVGVQFAAMASLWRSSGFSPWSCY